MLHQRVAANLLSARIQLRYPHKVDVNNNIEWVHRFQAFHSFVEVLACCLDLCLTGDRAASVGMYLVGIDYSMSDLVDWLCPEIAHTHSHSLADSSEQSAIGRTEDPLMVKLESDSPPMRVHRRNVRSYTYALVLRCSLQEGNDI